MCTTLVFAGAWNGPDRLMEEGGAGSVFEPGSAGDTEGAP